MASSLCHQHCLLIGVVLSCMSMMSISASESDRKVNTMRYEKKELPVGLISRWNELPGKSRKRELPMRFMNARREKLPPFFIDSKKELPMRFMKKKDELPPYFIDSKKKEEELPMRFMDGKRDELPMRFMDGRRELPMRFMDSSSSANSGQKREEELCRRAIEVCSNVLIRRGNSKKADKNKN